MKWILPIMMIIAVSCTSKQDANNQRAAFTIGKYLYEDDNGIIHIDETCLNLRRGNDDNGHKIYGKHMIDTAEFVMVEPQYFRVCSRCVNDDAYKHLLKISKRNKRYSADRHWIYDKLIDANYDMDSYEEFVNQLSDSEKRNRLYQAALEEGWDVGTFEEFSNGLGFRSETK